MLFFGRCNNLRLPIQSYELIKRTVVNMLVKHQICCLPISGFEIATKMDVTVIPYTAYQSYFDKLCKFSYDGFSVLRDGKWYIFYNDTIGYGRINYTIMHEIGHIVLNHKESNIITETEANFFAKYTLVPPAILHNLHCDTSDEMSFISDVFGVSYTEAIYAKDYYEKWLKHGNEEYTDYESRLLRLFNIAV